MYVFAALMMLCAFLVFLGLISASDQTWQSLGLFGVAVTVGAIGASIQIFNLQSIDLARQSQERDMKQAVVDLDLPLDKDEIDAAKGDQVQLDEVERAHEAALVNSSEGTTTFESNGKAWRVYPRQEVPLFVLADLVFHWRGQAVAAQKDGNWVVQNLVGAARREGQGSHPWLVVFRARDGQRHVYRLYRGGRGNSGLNAGHVRRLE